MTNEEGCNKFKKDTFKNKKWKDVRKMGHYEGFNAAEDGVEVFIKRIAEVWATEKSKPKGKAERRYELTLGTKNRIAVFEPTVTTSKGVKTILVWNLSTEDKNQIKKKTDEIGLLVAEVPYYWPEIPAVFPEAMPPENIPPKREAK